MSRVDDSGSDMDWRSFAVPPLNADAFPLPPLGVLVDGWQAEIRKLVRELDSDPCDHSVWGAHDFLGMLHLRDIVDQGLAQLPSPARADANRLLEAADRQFVDLTEPDDQGMLQRFVPSQPIGTAWWWRRVPKRGPVRFDLSRLDSA